MWETVCVFLCARAGWGKERECECVCVPPSTDTKVDPVQREFLKSLASLKEAVQAGKSQGKLSAAEKSALNEEVSDEWAFAPHKHTHTHTHSHSHLHAHTETHTETHTHTHTHSHLHAHTETHTHTHTHTHIQKHTQVHRNTSVLYCFGAPCL